MDKMNIEIQKPLNVGFTVYSKSGCINCVKIKNMLHEKHLLHTIINCDDFLFDNKEYFLDFIKNMTGTNIKTFPIVFSDGKFIGGFAESTTYIDKLLLFIDDNLVF